MLRASMIVQYNKWHNTAHEHVHHAHVVMLHALMHALMHALLHTRNENDEANWHNTQNCNAPTTKWPKTTLHVSLDGETRIVHDGDAICGHMLNYGLQHASAIGHEHMFAGGRHDASNTPKHQAMLSLSK